MGNRARQKSKDKGKSRNGKREMGGGRGKKEEVSKGVNCRES
jgi:hypothetical protein